ncbi:MAG TPA: hypothetical protein VMS17_18885 [Gemmataceae bacterium]|nr:hypothetical protein [Gemmataceae bacterium]
MNTIKATVRNRRIELTAPEDLPDGTEVLIDVTPLPPGKIGLEEAEWRDDPAALADWAAWMKTIEPLELTVEEQAAGARFEEEFRRFNVEAVRKQMAGGDAG